jgi:3-oxoadipate CoA-transferase beta subunit
MTGWTSDQMAARAAADLEDGAFVNLGIGLPERVADFVPSDREVILHSENGILGMGPRPEAGHEDFDLINAGKKCVSLNRGGAFFHHADSFAMIRGRHIDVCVLGAYEVACNGDLANWSTGQGGTPGVGGAMDLANGARSVWVLTMHTTREGRPKLMREISLPATGRAAVQRIYTNLAVLRPAGKSFELIELAPGCDWDTLCAHTGAPVVAQARPAHR